MEPFSALPFYINRAWVGAHMRLGLVASGMPGETQDGYQEEIKWVTQH